jgi:hypothetical protein
MLKKTWRVYRLHGHEGRPGDRAWREPCIYDKQGYDACSVQSSSSPVAPALRDGGDQADYSVGTRPKASSVKINSNQHNVVKEIISSHRLQRPSVAIK